MEEKNILFCLSQNLTKLRKAHNLTQLELSEKINYSDKSISKWERGESAPDIFTLKQLAEFYGVSVDYLITEHIEPTVKPVKVKRLSTFIVSLLSMLIPWLIATVVFVVFGIIMPSFTDRWLIFIYAIPVSSVIFLVFTSVWGRNFISCLFSSIICWSVLLSIFLSILSFVNPAPNSLWLIFLVGVPIQIMIILLFFLKQINVIIKKIIGKDKNKNQE